MIAKLIVVINNKYKLYSLYLSFVWLFYLSFLLILSLLLKCCHPPSTIYKFNCKLLNWIQWFTHLTNNLICITTTWHPAFFYYYFFRFLVIESSTSLWALLSICWSVGPLGHWLVHYGQSLFPIKTSMAYYFEIYLHLI